MAARSFLDQLLQTGMSTIDQAGQAMRRDDMGKYATGAAVGGVLGLLLGTRRGRSLSGSAIKYGSVAAIGALAWKAYQDWQAQQQAGGQAGAASGAASSASSGASSVAGSAGTALPAPTAFEALPAPQQEEHGRAMLKALIAAAKSDGHLDERERGLVEAEMQRLDAAQADPALRQWLEGELRRPIDPADVAAAATTPQLASEIYLASLLAVDETTAMERAYLDELAKQLRLAPTLKAELEARARAA
jgi:uncharacterized membrane protein YebE (DUF533 family)